MESLLIIVHLIAAIAITGLVLIQHGKGADAGASFGAGASQTMFGSMGSGNFLTKSTTMMTVIFFVTSIGLAIVAKQQAGVAFQGGGLIGDMEEITELQQRQQSSDLPVVESAPTQGDMPLIEDMPSLEEASEMPVEEAGE